MAFQCAEAAGVFRVGASSADSINDSSDRRHSLVENKGVRALYFSKGLLLAAISTGERAASSCYKKMEEDSGAAWYLGFHFNKFPQRHLHQGQ